MAWSAWHSENAGTYLLFIVGEGEGGEATAALFPVGGRWVMVLLASRNRARSQPDVC